MLNRNIDTTQTTKQQPAYIKFRIKTGNKEPACLTLEGEKAKMHSVEAALKHCNYSSYNVFSNLYKT